MARHVVDASVAYEYLLGTRLGLRAADAVRGSRQVAPELMYAEVLSALRRETLRGRIGEDRAISAINALLEWPVDCIPHRSLIRRAWRLRHNVSAYDAFYIAAAQEHGLTLLTADSRLARIPQLGIAVLDIRDV